MGVILGLGSNEGNRLSNLSRAIRALDQMPEVQVSRVSPLYESDAMLPEGGASEAWNQPFLNLAVECSWRGSERPSAERLLESVKRVERELGRRARERWAPRLIDIDILDWDGDQVVSKDLSIPHAGLEQRPFALLPFLDLKRRLAMSREVNEALALRWRLGGEAVPFRTRRAGFAMTRFMGVVNLTPDSFSDGGLFGGKSAIAQVNALVAAGAGAIDLGAESTRPGARAVTPKEELERLLPVLEGLRASLPGDVLLSVDTRHPEVARRALECGADWINDVTGFDDPAMVAAVRESNCRVVAMHSLGIPPSRDRLIPGDFDPIEYLLEWGRNKLAALEAAGIARGRVILDPGIGFGTSPKQAWRILASAERLHELGCEILIGHSRKSFLAEILADTPNRPASDRDLETATLSALLAAKGIEWLRVHAIDASARAVRSWVGLDGVVHWRGSEGA